MYKVWLKHFDTVDESAREATVRLLDESGVETSHEPDQGSIPGLVLLRDVTAPLVEWLQDAGRRTTILAIAISERGLAPDDTWRLMAAGAADVLVAAASCERC